MKTKDTSIKKFTEEDEEYYYMTNCSNKVIACAAYNCENNVITLLGVDEDHRNLGMGSKLINYITSEHPNTLVDVNINNVAAIQFCLSNGYKIFSIENSMDLYLVLEHRPNDKPYTEDNRLAQLIDFIDININ